MSFKKRIRNPNDSMNSFAMTCILVNSGTTETMALWCFVHVCLLGLEMLQVALDVFHPRCEELQFARHLVLVGPNGIAALLGSPLFANVHGQLDKGPPSVTGLHLRQWHNRAFGLFRILDGTFEPELCKSLCHVSKVAQFLNQGHDVCAWLGAASERPLFNSSFFFATVESMDIRPFQTLPISSRKLAHNAAPPAPDGDGRT